MTDQGKAGYVHSIDTCGMVDGPGIRYLVFFAGCALRCKYCHNPDTWDLQSGKLMTVDEIVQDIKRYKSYLKFSGGGVTFTGGDPFLQPDFLAALLKACKAEGFHTVIDTSGYASKPAVEKALPHTDLLLLDIKSINPDVFKAVTDVPIDRTLRTLRLSNELGVKVWVRFVLVPGLTDNLEDIRQLAQYLKAYDNVEKVEVVPFHKAGEYKWRDLGHKYELEDTQPPTPELLEVVRRILGGAKGE